MYGIGSFSPPAMITRTDDRSRPSMPGWSSTARSIAGAIHTVVTLDRSISSTTSRGVERAVDDRRRADRDHRGGDEIEGADVVQRPAREPDVARREAELGDVGVVLPRQVGVGEHHALRPSRSFRRCTSTGGCRRRRPPPAAGIGSPSRSAKRSHPSVGSGDTQTRARADARPVIASSARSISASSHTSTSPRSARAGTATRRPRDAS